MSQRITPTLRFHNATVRRICGLGRPDPWKDNGDGPMSVPASTVQARRARNKRARAARRANR